MPGLWDGALPDSQAIAFLGEPSLRQRSAGKALSSRQIALRMVQAALDAKAEDLVILDLRRLSFSFDFFVLCSAASDRRIQTVGEEIQERLSGNGIRPWHLEGQPESGWLLLDYGPVVGHIFSAQVREFYGLERLWADAPHLSIPRDPTT